MGMDATAALFYGILTDSPEELLEDNSPLKPDDDNYSDWEEVVSEFLLEKVFGAKEPTVDWATNEEVWRDWWAKKRKLFEQIPVRFIHWGHDYGGYAFIINESYTGCSWGPDALGKQLYSTDNTLWDKVLKEYCGYLGFKYSDPQWYMVASFG